MATLASSEEDHFNSLLLQIHRMSTNALTAYECDLASTVVPEKTQASVVKEEVKEEEKQKRINERRARPRHGSMIQNSGISAYSAKRSHHRMASTGINIRVPYEKVERPPPLLPEQQRPRAKHDPDYVQVMLDQARDARIQAEKKETQQRKIASEKLERILHEEKQLKNRSERDIVRQHVLSLAERHDREKQGVTEDSDYDTEHNELYELWHRRNSYLMKKKSTKHPERDGGDGNGIVDKYYTQVRLHDGNAFRTMKSRMNVFTLLGTEEKKEQAEKVVSVETVFSR